MIPSTITGKYRRTFVTILTLLLLSPLRLDAAESFAERLQSLRERAEELRAGTGDEAERFLAFSDLYLEWTVLEFPNAAQMVGLPGDPDRWADNSLAAEKRRAQDDRLNLSVLRSIDREKLGKEDRLSHDLLVEQLEQSVAGERFPSEYLVLNQLGGIHQDLAYGLEVMPTSDVADCEHLLTLLRGVDTLIENELERLRKGLALGVTPPRVTLGQIPRQVLDVIGEEPLQSPILRPFAEMSESIPPEEAQRLRTAAIEIFSAEIAPALRKYHDFLVDEYIPGARETIAMKDLPDGSAWYAHEARMATTVDRTPREIHELGLAEVARIRAEMEKVIRESGFEGDFAAFTEFLRSDPRFYYTEAEDLLTGYRDIAKRADAELPKLFRMLPRTPYGVAPVPDYGEETQTTAFYQRGSLEAGRAGRFYANTYKLDSRPKWEMEALTLHEAVPGHHLQFSLAQEMKDLPWFRRFAYYPAFSEGWGLYAESLGEEMGFYRDPYSKFGRLTYEMWRAIRLVIDTGIHAFGWSRERAIEYFRANSSKSEHDIVVEVDRYIVTPGQALAYKIGELKIKELRALAEAELGEDFDLREFHDTVLGSGAVPLGVLEKKIGEWIRTRRQTGGM